MCKKCVEDPDRYKKKGSSAKSSESVTKIVDAVDDDTEEDSD